MKPVCLILTALLASPLFAQPQIFSIEPASGPASGGTLVHITGSDLIGFPLLCPAKQCSDYVEFGGVTGSISVNSGTEIVALTPPHAPGSVDVVVNVAGKATLAIPDAFRYDAQREGDVERILLPVVLNGVPVPGAFGSMWASEIIFHNASDRDLPIDAPNCNPILLAPCPPPLRLAPGSTAVPTLYAANGVGVFVYVARQDLRDIDIALRIQDISRQALTWGTAIPVVRASDFQSLARLNGVPTDARFRTTLRVYGYGGTSDPIALRIFDPGSSRALIDTRLELRGSFNAHTDPAYLQIGSLTETYPQIRGHDVVRVEVESASTPPRPLWAFVSVTSNETQQVTVIAPSPTVSP